MSHFIRTGAVTVAALVISTVFLTSAATAQTLPDVPVGDYIPADKPEPTAAAPAHLPATAFVRHAGCPG
jgi:hypothetical protein